MAKVGRSRYSSAHKFEVLLDSLRLLCRAKKKMYIKRWGNGRCKLKIKKMLVALKKLSPAHYEKLLEVFECEDMECLVKAVRAFFTRMRSQNIFDLSGDTIGDMCVHLEERHG